MSNALLTRRCTICGAFDVELYDEVKHLGPRCVDRAACERRWLPMPALPSLPRFSFVPMNHANMCRGPGCACWEGGGKHE